MRRTESCPAGSHPRGASPFGLLDLSGGVYEWTGDRFGPYPSAAGEVVDPRGSTVGATRVYRGGSWRSDVASFVRAASRISIAPTSRSYVVGFRCAADVRPAGHVPD